MGLQQWHQPEPGTAQARAVHRVRGPNRHEGIARALTSAYAVETPALPDDMAMLLARLD